MTAVPFSDVRSALQALQQSPATRWSARIAAVLQDIEQALQLGASRTQVHTTLNEYGIDISFEGFKKALYRLRKRQREASTVSEGAKSASNGAVARQPASSERQREPERPQHAHVAPTPVPVRQLASVPAAPAAVTPSVASAPPSASGWTPGSIGAIARSEPDMTGLAKKGREYAAKLHAEKKRKADEAAANGREP